uniref:uncharacterized protein LOC122580537 n=1 Tax=Erigeron canadensis TaxID=72917 RepID=UPI001CB9352E|nr:uncharacterized protein LOC122580537 [Erigeron canadensis]
MALTFGKITLIIGAGIVGSVLIREGRMPGVVDVLSVASDVVTGASKVLKLVKTDGVPTSSTRRPVNDSLLSQVTNLRQELQLLTSNRPVTIVTTSRSGATRKFTTIIIVVVAGYGYVCWKGWTLPSMMFATKRSLADATDAVARQLESVYSSLSDARMSLSSRIDQVDSYVAKLRETSLATEQEVSELSQRSSATAKNLHSVHNAVFTLESRLNRIESVQDDTNIGVGRLLRSSISLENQGNPFSSSRPALGMPQRATFLQPVQIEELQPTPPVSPKARLSLETSVSASGLRVPHENPDMPETRNTQRASNGFNFTEEGSSNSGVFGRTFSGISTVFSRYRP